ncbi:MAG: AbrB/MazE/SpoVT family DNA-binding domain-containing protein [bacterium]
MPVSMKLGKKSQIVIPKEIRNAVGLSEGDEIILDVLDDKIILKQKPKSYSRKLKGLHKDVWKGVDPLKYVRKERESW